MDDDGNTLTTPIFPDTFPEDHGVHFVGNYGGVFLVLRTWTMLRKCAPSITQWLSTSRIVVDDALPTDPEMFFRPPEAS
jgi:hypothetical protein